MGRRALVLEEIDHDDERLLVIGFDVPRLSCLEGLSPAELAVIALWIEGLSMSSIARARESSIRTVANQIRSVYVKMGVSSRGELLSLVHEQRQRVDQSDG